MFVGYESLNDRMGLHQDADGNRLAQNYQSLVRVHQRHDALQGRRRMASGTRFPKMESAVVVNDIPDVFPDDVNYDYYI